MYAVFHHTSSWVADLTVSVVQIMVAHRMCTKWPEQGSNLWLLACKASALPAELSSLKFDIGFMVTQVVCPGAAYPVCLFVSPLRFNYQRVRIMKWLNFRTARARCPTMWVCMILSVISRKMTNAERGTWTLMDDTVRTGLNRVRLPIPPSPLNYNKYYTDFWNKSQY